MELHDCLPSALRGSATTITKIAAGMSGAGVYRVEAHGQVFVLKITAGEPVAEWRRKVAMLARASDAGLAPRVVHTDEERRAVVSEFVIEIGLALIKEGMLGSPGGAAQI